ncbi:PhnP protein [Trypanosoma grayi]|uniref:PhnP protein n=1 Tax=Trypanosoma grayi TaxID=71804 RepID=UPI0004F49F9C|nr:PhnP protein [Trypanosoma grayi]KEG14456.1 PhnP protein [Trypanosoma grayi]
MQNEMKFLRGLIVGAGSSTSTPMLSCIATGSPCPTCAEALERPRSSRNHRLNPSFLLQMRHPTDGTVHNILIDCGKTFRESAIKVLSTVGVADLSALLLTHDHADAAFGIDDLRDYNRPDTALEVFTDERTAVSMQRTYPYLFPKDGPAVVGAWRKNKTNYVASIKWITFEPLQKVTINVRARVTPTTEEEAAVATWSLVPIAVPHGVNYCANAFLMPLHMPGEHPRLLLYVSDISTLEERFFTDVAKAKEILGVPVSTPIEVLLLDMVSRNPYVSHLHVDASIEAARRIQAGMTYFVGMSHSLNYGAMTQELRSLGVGDRMAMGYDGCVVAVGKDTSAQL